MSDMADRIVSMALLSLPDDRVPTEEEIREAVDRLVTAFGVGAAERTAILQKVLARRLVKMDTGFALCEDHVPWVDARRPTIDPFYWSRFKLLLQKDWAPGVITGLDRSTDAILDLLGNPEETGTWKRRGLVMGDVQSGKTATYSALICKAADAGYRFVVLLTGTIENLRRQTQERLDIGFVGFDSSEQLKRNGRSLRVGVGLLDGTRHATVFTSSAADFRVATLEALGLSLDALREPALVVIKKHTRILKNLRDWIQNYNMGAQSGGIDIPMLMIDDEADNASINTNDEGQDPTAVNAGIRELLKLFRRTTYVGFTATPFANIFVNPETEKEMLGDDLFPHDFIYALEAASNYFGPRRVFLDDVGGALHLREITDVEEALPSSHRSDAQVASLPPSLIEALCAFLVANAIRDLRGDQKTHRSMLVNVSHFTRVQDQVETLLHDELERFKNAIRSFGALPPDKALEDPCLLALFRVWEREFTQAGFDWASIQTALHDAVLPITTKAVNQRTGPRALDYRAHRETGLRVIAVGGNSLSRGLTLEGLMVSYFRRTTKMYDTLLQMGRWFGYRPGYQDLCRVWIPVSTMDWYGHIADATDELRDELRRMYRLNRTPKDFGLAVRAHPDALLVTARNKMRTAKEVTWTISLSTQSFESVELPTSPRELERNSDRVTAFVAGLTARVGTGVVEKGVRLIRGATRLEVATLLRSFTLPVTEFRFQPDRIADLLERMEGETLDDWDVGIPGGEGTEVPIGGLSVSRQKRRVLRQEPPGVWVVSGKKRRVGSRGVERAGLSDPEIAAAEADAREFADANAAREGLPPPARINVADRFYRARRSRPLLLLHVLQGEPEGDAKLPELRKDAYLVAIGLSFPELKGTAAREVTYKINLVKAKELLFAGLGEPSDDDDFTEDDL
ncbi:MAG: Z1 domain-containing protein [Planctomycetes bacterium]|nr:Z1 domain-containing protein [Planctomycetota bacterium]